MATSSVRGDWPSPGSVMGGQHLTPQELLGLPVAPLTPSYYPPVDPNYLRAVRDLPPQAVLDAIADCPRGVEVTGDYESVVIRPLLIWQAALDALTAGNA